MATIQEQLIKHIDEAYAMEQDVLRDLAAMIETTADASLRSELEEHKQQTEQHAERLKLRLQTYAHSPSAVREAGGMVKALMKSVVDIARTEKAGRNLRDAYATEHMEMGSYQLLERVASRAGDTETVEVARRNRSEEEEMARKLGSYWDTAAELSLREAGVEAQARVPTA